MNSVPKNQGKACDAVLKILEGRLGKQRENWIPDSPGNAGVEVTCSIGATTFALEHTRIDQYPGRQMDDQQFLRILEPVMHRLNSDHLLPVDSSLHLIVPVHAARGIKRHKVESIGNRLREWILWSVDALRLDGQGRTVEIWSEPAGVPFRVTLQRTLGAGGVLGALTVGRYVPPDLEQLRQMRIHKALIDKCPKLHVCKRAGAVSILILEDSDISISNPIVIGLAVQAEIPKHNMPPDEIYLLDTYFDRWKIWGLKRGEVLWPPRTTSGEDYEEFDSGALRDVLALRNDVASNDRNR